MGYIIDEKGVHMESTKIQVVWYWKSSNTLTDLHRFLGLANFYWRFVLGFSHITWPLNQITMGRVKEKVSWSESQQKVFIELKHRICIVHVLTLLDL